MRANQLYTAEMLELNLDTWLISDTHFGHGNIVKYSNRPENHNELMLDYWREAVGPDDIVLHLGDIAMTGPNARDLYPRILDLPGQKFMIRGNHDTGTLASYRRLGFEVVADVERPSRSKNGMQGGSIKRVLQMPNGETKIVALSHTPCGRDLAWDINIHGHIHTNGYPSGLFLSGRDYRNICVEVIGYKPVRLRDVVFGTSFQAPFEAGIGHDRRLEEFD